MAKMICRKFGSLNAFNEFKNIWTSSRNSSSCDDSSSSNSSSQKYSDAQLKSVFDKFDQDRNGNLDKDEIEQLLLSSGEYPSHSRITQLINSVDKNGDGRLNFQEFLKLYSKYRADPERARFDESPTKPKPVYTRAIIAINN